MGNILTSSAFWFGTAVLLAYQGAKFSELSGLDSARSTRASSIPNLRASDFAGPTSFFGALVVYLAATFAVYLAACSIAPSIIVGWAVISGGGAPPKGATESGAFPLYLAALYMGLTQPAIPVLSSIGNMQRDLFHYWIGVPKRVVSTSDFFINQLLARAADGAALVPMIERLTSDRWIAEIDRYADVVFYREQLKRLKLSSSDAMREAVAGSPRELRNLLDHLVYAASIAAVRESGGRALEFLARDLDVRMPDKPDTHPGRLLPGAVVSLAAMVFALFALPMAVKLAKALGITLSILWPASPHAAGLYLLAQMVPLLLAAALVLHRTPSRQGESRFGGVARLVHVFELHAPLILGVFALVLIFDYTQMLSDYSSRGSLDREEGPGAVARLLAWAPYHMLHAMIAVSACFVLLLFVQRAKHANNENLFGHLGKMVAVVALVSAFYALARLQFQFKLPVDDYFDFVILIVVLNVASAVLALLAAASAVRMAEGAALRGGEALVPVSSSAAPVVSFPAPNDGRADGAPRRR